MAFLIVFFTVALSLCVVGLVVISLWWSLLFLAAILGSVRPAAWRHQKRDALNEAQ
jgi:Flp pilus assembly protein TadB